MIHLSFNLQVLTRKLGALPEAMTFVARYTSIAFLVFRMLAVLCHAEVESPKLVVFIVVDQMRNDYLDRFGDLFEGGLKYLLEKGVRCTNTYHAHAYTATAPGHLALISGLFPGTAGIIGNDWYDRSKKKMVHCVADEKARLLSGDGTAVSYGNVGASALGDWIKAAHSQSKVFSVSSKDPAAVLMGGRNADGVFWLDWGSGEYVTSDYYMKQYPDWIQRFNGGKPLDRYVGKTWTRLSSDESIYVSRAREDEFPPEASGDNKASTSAFPHYYPHETGEEPIHYWALWESPWLDAVALELAKVIVRNEDLGQDEHPDFLGISLSLADGVGHRYGPYSQETMDMFLRMDQFLQDFFDFLNKEVGLRNILLVLSSDHGVAMLPEYARRLGLETGRVGGRMKNLARDLEQELRYRWGDGSYIENLSGGNVYYNRETLEEKGISESEANAVVIPRLQEEKWIQEIHSRAKIETNTDLSYFGLLWRNQYHPERSGDLFLTFKENYVWKYPAGTGHGTPHDYDTKVPLIFVGATIAPGLINERVRTVDVAPTMASLLKIDHPTGLDGRPLDLKALSSR